MEEQSRISRSRVPGRGTLSGYKEDLVPVKPAKASPIFFRDVQIEKIEWLWFPYIPYGKLTMLSGDPGVGKSFITDAIAAAVSNGDPFPGQPGRSRGRKNVLMFAGEDDPGDTIKPRLISLDADMSRVAVYAEDLRLDPDGLATIDRMVEETRAELFIIDPIVAYLGAKLDMNRANEVRPMLKGLMRIAHKHRAAAIIVRHMRKQGTNGTRQKAIYSGQGSIDFTAAVRSELQAEEGKDGTHYLNHVKASNAPRGKSVTYSIIDDEFQWGELVDGIEIKRAARVSHTFAKEEQAKLLIYDMLKDHPEGVHSNDIYDMAKQLDISERVMKSAKTGLVRVEKQGNHWVWKLDAGAPRVGTSAQGVSADG